MRAPDSAAILWLHLKADFNLTLSYPTYGNRIRPLINLEEAVSAAPDTPPFFNIWRAPFPLMNFSMSAILVHTLYQCFDFHLVITERKRKLLMNKGFYHHLIYSLTILIVFSASVSAQDSKVHISGSKIKVTDPDGSVQINGSRVNVNTSEGSSVKIDDKTQGVHSGKGDSVTSAELVYSDDVLIDGRSIKTDGNGIILKGQGNFVLNDCTIVAGKNAIIVTGKATVTIKNCSIRGKRAAILISENGTVKATANAIKGKIKRRHNADFIDGGSNTILDY